MVKKLGMWLRKEDGEMMTEAVIVMAVTVMVVFSLLNIAVFIMQKGNLVVHVNRAAVQLAGEYRDGVADLYRSSDMDEKFRSEEISDRITQRIAQTELFHPASVPDPSMEFVKCRVDITGEGQKIVEVLAARYYQVLAVNPCAYFGLDTMYQKSIHIRWEN